MPRTVDHGERRSELTDAVARIAARDGLQAVTMRAVAAEAGVSLRLVQYYFENKHGLLIGAMRRLEEQSNARWRARLSNTADPRAMLHAFISEALPTDPKSTDFYRVSAAFGELARTDTELAAEPLAGGLTRLRSTVLDTFRAADLPPDADPEAETDALISLCNGLSTAVLIGHHSADEAVAIAEYQLNRSLR